MIHNSNKKDKILELFCKAMNYDLADYIKICDEIHAANSKCNRMTYRKKGKQIEYRDVDSDFTYVSDIKLGESGRAHIYNYNKFDPKFVDLIPYDEDYNEYNYEFSGVDGALLLFNNHQRIIYMKDNRVDWVNYAEVSEIVDNTLWANFELLDEL